MDEVGGLFEVDGFGGGERGEGSSQGVESSWAAMVSSMLASPPVRYRYNWNSQWGKLDLHGASEQYM